MEESDGFFELDVEMLKSFELEHQAPSILLMNHADKEPFPDESIHPFSTLQTRNSPLATDPIEISHGYRIGDPIKVLIQLNAVPVMLNHFEI